MTDTPGPLPPPPPQRRGHGCLWGCLIALVIAILAGVGTFSYLGWYLTSGFKNDPSLQMAVAAVSADQEARAILGDDIRVDSVSSTSINSATGTATTETYVAHIKGTRGAGTLEATIVSANGKSRITVLTLTTPDGRRIDLAAPAPQVPSNSI